MIARSPSPFLRIVLGLFLLGSLVLGDVSPASAALRCYVKAGATPPGTGLSWNTAYPDLQTALANAACTEIWVAAGTYKPTSGTDRQISFDLKNGVSIYGGFAGTETQLSQRNPAANLTVLSGQIGTPDAFDNSFHVVRANGTSSTAILDGFKVVGGYSGNGFGGGGMFVSNSGTPSVINMTFSGNLATFGGGMYNESSSPILVNVTFSNNSTDVPNLGGGAGLYNYQNSSPILTNVTFNANSAATSGGGMYNNASNPILTNVTFSGNSATNTGGAIYNANGSSPNIRNSILYGDTGGEIINADTSNPVVIFSIVQGGFTGTGNLDVNPLLKPAGNYGGFTQTMALGPGSPAIDSGTNSVCPATDQRGIVRPKDGDGNGSAVCDMGATESRVQTITFKSNANQDGWVRESGENTGVGGGSPDAASEILLAGDLNQKSQIRSILSFNTGSLPDNAPITSVKVMVKKAGQVGPVDPFTILGNLVLDVREGAFSGNPALQLTDFQAPASRNAALTIKNPPAGGWYTGSMGTANFKFINKSGITQFRLRFAVDDNNDSVANELKLYSGNTLTAADRPKLVIKYYLP